MIEGRYGVDAPGLVRGFLFAGMGAGAVGLGLLKWAGSRPWAPWTASFCFMVAAYGVSMCAFMLWESLVTKVRGRDAILDLVRWTGQEHVLDVGCGRGLLLVGAAHRLTTGHAFGIDLWLLRDQSSNDDTGPLTNARVENVTDRVSVKTGDMRALPFPDDSFDVVMSSWAVHNLELQTDRERAMSEMVRVLKPGGSVLLNDIVNRDEYIRVFEHLGMADVRLVIESRWRDLVCAAVSCGTFRPATVLARDERVSRC